MVGSEWDMPSGAQNAPAASRDRVSDRRRVSGGPGDGWTNGLLDPLALLAWGMRNFLPIAVLAAVLTALGVGMVLLISFPYRATAIVLADPRDQRITLQEEVLPSIGADAAVLESMVQIVRSDGFLLDVMRDLGIGQGDGSAVDRGAELRELGKFRRDLTVERKGATYLVEISYRASTPEEAARVANGIAEAFADSQNDSRAFATQSAAQSLADQLVEIRARLTESEEAVTRFRADNGIVYVDERNTVQMRQLGELNQQLALVRNATEEARARYEEHRSGGALTRGGQGADGEGGQLGFLRQQRAQLIQLRDQQTQVYGPRHPRLVQTQETLEGLEQEIARERVLLADQLKAELDVAVAKQAQMEQQIAQLSSNVTLADSAKVELEALEREATANRELYQDLLSRNKATGQLALLARDNVRVVSSAVAPINSTRPSLKLLFPVIGFLSLLIATTLVVAFNFRTLRKPTVRRAGPARPQDRQPGPAATVRTQRPVAAQPLGSGGSLLNAAPPPMPRHPVAHEPRGRLAREDLPYDPYAARR